ncbi:MAG: hypothetical protein MZV70_13160 [Desulfobacterales bacterium]|nr:hypothetical protein [Desulfobacterales bacterium]
MPLTLREAAFGTTKADYDPEPGGPGADHRQDPQGHDDRQKAAAGRARATRGLSAARGVTSTSRPGLLEDPVFSVEDQDLVTHREIKAHARPCSGPPFPFRPLRTSSTI